MLHVASAFIPHAVIPLPMGKFFVYILSNSHHTVFYTGFTNDLVRRVFEHKNGVYEKSFSKKYNVHKLLYFEVLPSAKEAMHREQQIKRYKRDWKENLINSINPAWDDLHEIFCER